MNQTLEQIIETGYKIRNPFKELKPAFIFNYKSRLEEGYLFEESSTTIENYIKTL